MLAYDLNKELTKQQKLISKEENSKLIELFFHENKEIKKLSDNFTEEFINIIYPIITHPKFRLMRTHFHHDNISTYLHVLQVAWLAYQNAINKNANYYDVVIGALLHDFYLYDWHKQEQRKPGLFNMHLFDHPNIALENSRKYFKNYLNPIIENSILSHSWHMYIIKKIFHPFSFKLKNHYPQYKESWIVSYSDMKSSMYSAKSLKMILKSIGMDEHLEKINLKLSTNILFLVFIAVFK